MSTIELLPVNEDNYRRVLALELAPGQEFFIASNTMSLAQAFVFPWLKPLAIAANSQIVGFMMHGLKPSTGMHWLSRLMIAKEFQGKGHGRAALHLFIHELVAKTPSPTLCLSLVPRNEAALKLYKDIGFKETGEVDEDGEIIMHLILRNP